MSAVAFWLGLGLKMAITAGLVVLASLTAERGGPLIGGMVATLPLSAGPAYVFLALDHDTHFIAASVLSSIVTNIVTGVFALVYATLAQRRGLLLSLAGALAVWVTLWFALSHVAWTLPRAGVLSVVVFAACLVLASRYRHAPMRVPARRWYDLPLRATMVALLVCLVVTVGPYLGPRATGMLAVFPVILTSLVLILHPRVGGRATAAVLANAISGLVGFGLALCTLYLTVVPLGAPAAYTLTLAISLGWNLMVWSARQRGIPL